MGFSFVPVEAVSTVNTNVSGTQTEPAFTALADGGYVISWTTYPTRTANLIKAQVFNADGSRRGEEILVNEIANGTQKGSALAALSNGGFVAVWYEYGLNVDPSNGDGSVIRARFFDLNGDAVGNSIILDTADLSNYEIDPSIAALADGSFALTWTTLPSQADFKEANQVWTAVYDSTGALLKAPTDLSTNPTWDNDQKRTSVLTLPDGGFVATWWDYIAESGDESAKGIKVRFYNQDGSARGPEIAVNQNAGLNGAGSSDVELLSNGNLIVAWSHNTGGGGTSIKTQVLGADGTKIGGEVIIATRSDKSFDAPAVAKFRDGSFAVVWADSGQIKSQAFNAKGVKQGGEMIVATAEAKNLQVNKLPGGEVLLTWEASDGSGSGIKSQVFRLNAAPVALDEKLTAIEDQPVQISVSTLLRNDKDADGDALELLSWTAGNGSKLSLDRRGTASTTDDILVFTPSVNFNGETSFSYTIADPHGLTSTAKVSVAVTAANDAPKITSSGGKTSATLLMAENKSAVTMLKASDVDAGAKLSWSLSGTDAKLFSINSKTGALSFRAAPDFEAPKDSGKNNTYDVTVKVSDGKLSDAQALTIKVTDVKGKAIKGSDKANTLKGTEEADTLTGGKGADKLYGNGGNDRFVFNALSDSTADKKGRDTIYDFAKEDRFDLSAIDASTKSKGNQAFSFIGTDKFHGKAGELRFEKAKSDTYIYADTNGDRKADFGFHLDDAIKLVKADFLL